MGKGKEAYNLYDMMNTLAFILNNRYRYITYKNVALLLLSVYIQAS